MTEPHSTSLYIPSGRGILYIAEWSGTVPPTELDYVDVGNCPSMEIEPTQERRPHYSSRAGLRVKDLNPVTQLDYTLTFDLDEISANNIKIFLMGTLNEATKVVSGMTNGNQEFAIKFVSDNPIGPDQIYYFHRCTIAPNAAMQLIGEEYLVMSYTAEGLADTEYNPDSPYFNMKYVTTTTTTTTTTTA